MTIPQELIDRFVDGEVNEEEWRKIIAAIPQDCDLSRRVALAFIESQLWSRSFHRQIGSLSATATGSSEIKSQNSRTLAGTSVPTSRPTGLDFAVNQAAGKGGRPNGVTFWLGMAVSLAAGFVLALVTIWFTAGALNGRKVPLSSPATQQLAQDTHNRPHTNVPTAPLPRTLPVEMVTIPVSLEGGPTLTTVDIPVISFPEGEHPIVWPEPVIPPQVWETLPQRGHAIRHERQFVPVRLSDGRQSIVPVDQVEIRFVGQREYR